MIDDVSVFNRQLLNWMCAVKIELRKWQAIEMSGCIMTDRAQNVESIVNEDSSKWMDPEREKEMLPHIKTHQKLHERDDTLRSFSICSTFSTPFWYNVCVWFYMERSEEMFQWLFPRLATLEYFNKLDAWLDQGEIEANALIDCVKKEKWNWSIPVFALLVPACMSACKHPVHVCQLCVILIVLKLSMMLNILPIFKNILQALLIFG